MPITYICHGCGNTVAVVDYDVKAKSIIIMIAGRKKRKCATGIDGALHALMMAIPRCPFCKAQLNWSKPLKIEVK